MIEVYDFNTAVKDAETYIESLNSIDKDNLKEFIIEFINNIISVESKKGYIRARINLNTFLSRELKEYAENNLLDDILALYTNAGYFCEIIENNNIKGFKQPECKKTIQITWATREFMNKAKERMNTMNNVIDINVAREMTEKGLETVNSLSEDGILDYLVESINKDILEFSKCGYDSFAKDFTQYIPEKFIPYVKRNLVKELKTLYKNAGYICSIENEESIIRGTSLFQITIDWSKRKLNYYNKPIEIDIAKMNVSNTRFKFKYNVDEYNVMQFLIDLINDHIIFSSKYGYLDMEFPVDKFIPKELLSNIDEYKNKLIEIYNSYGYKCNIIKDSNTIIIDWDRI